jgi:large repetitive protein
VSVPVTYTWTVVAVPDTTAPEVEITARPDELTTVTSATFEFEANEPATFQCSLDGAALAPCTSPVTHHGLGEGEHTFTVVATDTAGNVSSPASYTWTVDSTAPTVTITSGPAELTSATSASFTFSANEAATFECSLDGATLATCTSPAVYSGLGLGDHTFTVVATDMAGSVGEPVTYTWTVVPEPDTTAPRVTITSRPDAETTATSATFEFEADEVGVTFECQLDEDEAVGCASPVTYTGLGLGEHMFTVVATDAAGNVSDPVVYTWTVVPEPDVTAPRVTLTSVPDLETTATSAYFAFTAVEPATFRCSLDGAALATCTSPAVYSGLGEGEHTFTVVATDAAGNVSDPVTYTWTVVPVPDTTAPEVTITSRPDAETTATSATFEFEANEPVTFECSLDGAALAPCTSPVTYTGLVLGPHTFTVVGTDEAGNDSDPVTYTWTIQASCPTTVTLIADGDAWVDQRSANSNFGSDLNLRARYQNGNRSTHTLVRFPLPDLPTGCLVDNAVLRMNASSSAPNRTLQALRITGPWAENTVTWNNQPATAGPAATTVSGTGWREWTTTEQVREMYNSGVREGFLVRDAASSGGGTFEQVFRSREQTQNKPELVLTFRPSS